jgi:hypothetical protein
LWLEWLRWRQLAKLEIVYLKYYPGLKSAIGIFLKALLTSMSSNVSPRQLLSKVPRKMLARSCTEATPVVKASSVARDLGMEWRI